MAMDRKIDKKKRPLWQWVGVAVLTIGAGWLAYSFLADASVRTYRASSQQLIVSTVEYGAFEDLIPIRGNIQPLNTVFLDAVNGGVVDQIFVEEGSFVEAGQPILQLSNNNLRLSAAQNDTSITEQLNFLGNITNGLETEKLRTEREIIDIQYRITVLERQKRRFEELVNNDLISEEEYEAVIDELEYQNLVLANTLSRQELEEEIRAERTTQISEQIVKLQENLEVSRQSFESLLVIAPISGQLTSLPVEIGQSKSIGERLGQIDIVDQYKIVASVDEFYVSRVSPSQEATFTLAGREFSAVVDKVYPEITQGTFEVDLLFASGTPSNLRRGQTLQMDLTLGNPVDSLLIPLGGFIQDTGGNWVFVVDETGEYAFRRDIEAGRRNNRYLEVRSGLEEDERVITSAYSQMEDVERIQLTR